MFPVRRLPSTLVLVATLLCVTAAGCSSSQQIPDPGPKPSGADFQGFWYSPQFEQMYLRQSGSKVTGVYSYEDGGRLEGQVDGNLLVFEWTDPGSKQHAEKTMSGRGYFRLVREDDTLKLKGEWGYDEDASGAGPWEANYRRELESGDPSSIEEIQNQDD